jgi:hypothetical protein
VVIGLVVAEPELVVPELDPELAVVTPDPELGPPDVPLAATAVFFDSAASWPATSWTKITAQSTANVTSAVAITRVRIRVTRRRRSRSRSLASARGSAVAPLRGGGAEAEEICG